MEKGWLEGQEDTGGSELGKIRRIFEAAPDGILTTTGDNRIVLANRRAAALLGRDEPDDLRGKNVLNLVSPEDRERAYIDGCGFLGWHPFLLTSYRMIGKEGTNLLFEVCRSVAHGESEEDMLWIWTLREGAGREALIRGILDRFEEERERMGWDLHDGISSRVSGVAFFLEALEKRWNRGDVPFSDIADMVEELRGVARTTRSLIHRSSPLSSRPGALSEALRELAERIAREYGLSCSVQEEQKIVVEDPIRAAHLYRIAQEAATNAAVHGKADHVEMRLRQLSDGKAELSVIDDGVGISKTVGNTDGMGTAIMNCRGQRIDAAVNIQEREDGGTVVTCTFYP